MIPLLHDFTDETVLIFGGGPVGARKARRFDREGRVIVVSPAFADEEFGEAELVRGAPDTDGVRAWIERADPALVVAATDDPAVNEAAETATRDRGSLVNRADRSGGRDPGSVVVPATVREDPVVVAIATGGRSPSLSKHLRERIEDEIEGSGAMAELTAEIRTELREAGYPAAERRAAVAAVVDSRAVWTALRTEETKRPQVVGTVIDDALEATGREP